MSKFYITTAIAYVNGKPHIGHLLDFVLADVIARYHRMKGDDVFLLTGTDEHGSKIYKKATELGMTVEDMVDENSQSFKNLWTKLNGDYTDFIRTTSENHKQGVAVMWNKLQEAGDLYKSSYEGLYCEGCETFMLEKDLVDGKCPNHMKEPITIKEENYFFKLSKYTDKLITLIESDELKIYPECRKNEMLSFLKEGLNDVSFSREKSQMPWGIPVPGDESQVMYVWCDALSNYLAALGLKDLEAGGADLLEKFWPADLQVLGKDILRFHALIWPAMLLSAGFELPKALGVHGFLTVDGQKMSKSIGNVVDPFEVIEKYGTDAVRYYLAREVPTGDDGDYSEERFEIVYNSELANNFGVPSLGEDGFKFAIEFDEARKIYEESIEAFNLKKALEEVVKLMSILNGYVEETKPWGLAKEEREAELDVVLANLFEGVKRLSILLWPFIPETIEKVFGFMNLEMILDLAKEWNTVVETGHTLGESSVLFPRLNS